MSSEPEENGSSLADTVKRMQGKTRRPVRLVPPDDPIYTETGVRVRWGFPMSAAADAAIPEAESLPPSPDPATG